MFIPSKAKQCERPMETGEWRERQVQDFSLRRRLSIAVHFTINTGVEFHWESRVFEGKV